MYRNKQEGNRSSTRLRRLICSISIHWVYCIFHQTVSDPMASESGHRQTTNKQTYTYTHTHTNCNKCYERETQDAIREWRKCPIIGELLDNIMTLLGGLERLLGWGYWNKSCAKKDRVNYLSRWRKWDVWSPLVKKGVDMYE